MDSQATEQQKLFPQSARTKCVKPTVSKINDQVEGIVKWNELFIFEVPRKVFDGLFDLELIKFMFFLDIIRFKHF